MYEEKRRMEIIADVLSEKLNLTVSLVEDGPSAAWYDGKALYLSRKRIKDMMTRMDDHCIKYLLYHESAHALMSDIATMNSISDVADGKTFVKGMSQDAAKVIANYTQALEDIRIEREISKKYDGVKQELDRKWDEIFTTNEEHYKEHLQEINPQTIGVASILKYRQKKYYDKLVSPQLKKVLDSPEVSAITDKIDTAKNSWDVFEIAKDLYMKTKSKLQSLQTQHNCFGKSEGEKKPGGKKSEGKGKPQPGKGEGEEQEGEGKEEKKPGEGDGSGKGSREDKDKKEGKGKGEGEKPKPQPKDVSDKVNKDTEAGMEQAKKELEKTIREVKARPSAPHLTTRLPEIPANWSPEFDIDDTYPILDEARAHDKEHMPTGKNIANYNLMETELSGFTRHLQRKVKDMFTLKTKSHYEAGHSSGKLISTKDLWKISNGSDKVFMKRYKEQNTDYAISILIDQSGSMGGSKLHEAQKSFIILAETLNELKIPFELLGFSTTGHDYSGSLYGGSSEQQREREEFQRRTRECRYDSTLHMIYKPFDSRFDDEVKARIGAIGTHGNNWDGEAVMWAAKRLLAQKAKEKILIVLSDGQPSGSNSSGKNCSFTKRVVKSVEKRIKTIGIGLLSNSPKEFYKNHVIIQEVKELPNVFCKILYQVLKRKH